MSTTTKKTSTKGIRYTDVQKKEVTDYAAKYNSDNGRGGQSKAAEKFNISPLTVATWMKATSGSSKGNGTAKAAKAPKAPKASKGSGKRRSRYSDEQKREVTDFVATYNSQNGRGGASVATKKFAISPLTVVAWLRAAGVSSKGNKKVASPKAGKSTSAAPVSGGISGKLKALLEVSEEIAASEASLAKLKEKFSSLKASL